MWGFSDVLLWKVTVYHFLSFTELVGTSWAKCVRKYCHARPDLQSCGSDSRLWVRCDDLEKYFLKAPWLLKPKLVVGKKVPGKARKLCPKGREPDPGREGKDLLSKLKIIHTYPLKYHAGKGEGCLIPSQGFGVPTLPFFHQGPPWQSGESYGSIILLGLIVAGARCLYFKWDEMLNFSWAAAKIKVWCLLVQVRERLQSPNTRGVPPPRCAVSSLSRRHSFVLFIASLLSPCSCSLVLFSFSLFPFLSF